MIQRLQSIFYLLTGVAFSLEFLFPFAISNINTTKYFEDFKYNIQDHTVLLVLTVLGAVLALVNIFMYKNRPLQIRLGYLLIILAILLPAMAVILILTDGNTTISGEQISERAGIFLPIVAIIMAVLGNRYVKKDENVVRSMDRLR